MKRSIYLDKEASLILPAFLLLVLLFVAPLVWFFAQVLMTQGGLSGLFEHAAKVLTSKSVIYAIVTTNWISLWVTVLTLLISYPIAYYLVSHKDYRFIIVIFCIIVPYFTSVIVRTYSWMVLLGRHGIINEWLSFFGIIGHPLPLMYNMTGVLIGMIYVMLPYMVLTLFSAMKAIDPNLTQAAQGLGATGFYTFSRIYFPLSFHGVISGSLIVFILSVGFFITPDLMGGHSDVMIAMLIDRSVEVTFNWTSAALMSLILLIVTLILYTIYYKLTDVRRMMGG
jgi:ABC-type spermidine/putrescine transport system permease subunit I